MEASPPAPPPPLALDGLASLGDAIGILERNEPATATLDDRDDGFFHDHQPRKNGTSFSAEAVQKLEATFEQETYPSVETRQSLADEFGLRAKQVQQWFQNKRQRLGLTTAPQPKGSSVYVGT